MPARRAEDSYQRVPRCPLRTVQHTRNVLPKSCDEQALEEGRRGNAHLAVEEAHHGASEASCEAKASEDSLARNGGCRGLSGAGGWRISHQQGARGRTRCHGIRHRLARSRSARRKSLTSASRRSMSSTRKPSFRTTSCSPGLRRVRRVPRAARCSAMRCGTMRCSAGMRSWHYRLRRLQLQLLPVLGSLPHRLLGPGLDQVGENRRGGVSSGLALPAVFCLHGLR